MTTPTVTCVKSCCNVIETVPCVDCGRPIDARRAKLDHIGGLCVACKAPTLAVNRKLELPEYETAVWARGDRL